jgi:hypothetical protein
MRQILYCNETVINCGKKLNTDLCSDQLLANIHTMYTKNILQYFPTGLSGKEE